MTSCRCPFDKYRAREDASPTSELFAACILGAGGLDGLLACWPGGAPECNHEDLLKGASLP